MYNPKLSSIFLNNFTLFVGPHRRWIEIRAVQKDRKGKWPQCPQLTGEFVIYSNGMRNAIGELLPEHNQENSILGSCFYDLDVGIVEFKGCETISTEEYADIEYGIKTAVVSHYFRVFGREVEVEHKVWRQ